MLDHSSGRQLLEDLLKDTNSQARFEDAIAALPSKLQPIATSIVDDDDLEDEHPTALFSLSEVELTRIFKIFSGDLVEAALATWHSIGQGPYTSYEQPLLFRSPKQPVLARELQWRWLTELVDQFCGYPADLTTAESLAVWAPYSDNVPMSLNYRHGWSSEGAYRSSHIGRLLARIIDGGGPAGQNVLDTLRLTIQDRHPSSTFGLHAIYACWNSRQAEVVQLIKDKLAKTTDPNLQRAIIRGASETTPAHFKELLSMVRETAKLQNKQVGEELLTWLMLYEYPYSKKLLLHSLDVAIASLARLEEGFSEQIASDEERLYYAWALMIRDVEEAVPELTKLIDSQDETIFTLAMNLVRLACHPALMPVLDKLLVSADLNRVVAGLNAYSTLLDRFPIQNEAEKHAVLERLAAVCRRGYAQRDTYPKLFGKRDSDFLNHIESTVRHVWTNTSLSIFGEAALDKRLGLLSFVRSSYMPPDDASIEALLCRAESEHDSFADILLRTPLKPEHWLKLVHVKPRYSSVDSTVLKAMESGGTEPFERTMRLLLADSRSKTRAIALSICMTANYGKGHPLAAASIKVGREFLAEPVPKQTTEEESRLRLSLQKLVEKADEEARKADGSIVNSDGFISASPRACEILPGLVLTPPWQPVFRPIERFNAACHQLLKSLDQFIEDNKDHLMALKAGTPTADDFPTLEDWRPYYWPEPAKELLANWWKQAATTLAGPGDLARLRTVWSQVHQLERLPVPIPETIDLTQLNSLKGLEYNAVFPERVRASASLDSIPDSEMARTYRGLRNLKMVTNTIEFLWRHYSTWEDMAYMREMAESILGAVPRELKDWHDNTKHGQLIGTWIKPDEDWTLTPNCLSYTLQPTEIARRNWRMGKMKTLDAFVCGAATLGDLVDSLIHISPDSYEQVLNFETIANIRRSQAKAQEWNKFFGILGDKLIEAELTRPAKELSPWTALVAKIGYLEGYTRFERMLLATAAKGFTRPTSSLTNQVSVWSILTSSIYPEPNCDFEQVSEKLKQLLTQKKITAAHLLEAALLAPQWREPIAAALAWPGLAQTILWLIAHASKIGNSNIETSVALMAWLASENVSARQKQDAIGYEEFFLSDWYNRRLKEQGYQFFEDSSNYFVVQMEWFDSLEPVFDDGQWNKLFEALEVILPPKKTEELKRLVEALRGRLDQASVFEEIQTAKRPVDARVLSLMPLATAPRRSHDLMERYRTLTVYRKACRRFMDSEEAIDRVDYALELLGKRAGASSQEDLEWMIQLAAADQFERLQVVASGEVESKLIVHADGQAAQVITKAGKVVKTLPASVKQEEAFVEQQQILKSLKKFGTHSKQMLQQALVQQREYSITELRSMSAHPVLGKMLASLLFIAEDQAGLLVGTECDRLLSIDESTQDLSKDAKLRLAHPLDLIDRGGVISWRDWLREKQLVQSIPQVERGFFLAEHLPHLREHLLQEHVRPVFGRPVDSRRFAMILKSKGWTEESEVDFEFHHFKPSVIIKAELRTHVRDLYTQMPKNSMFEFCSQSQVPRLVFSEAVSDVYHAMLGSARESAPNADLKQAIAQLIDAQKLSNVRWDGNRLSIDGILGSYTVDVAAMDIRMLPNQYIPAHLFGNDPRSALLGAINALSMEVTEREVLASLKIF